MTLNHTPVLTQNESTPTLGARLTRDMAPDNAINFRHTASSPSAGNTAHSNSGVTVKLTE